MKNLSFQYFYKMKKYIPNAFVLTCWQMEISVGVNALLSGVVPRNLIILMGFLFMSHTVLDKPALFANKDVLPHPPSP